MSRLDELIAELCPNGFEYKKISEICNKVFAGGTPKTNNSDYYDGDIPWLRSGEINFNVIRKVEKMITEKGLNNSSAKWIKENSVLIAMTGATVARSAVCIVPLTANQSVCAMEPNEKKVNYKYLYYCIEGMYLIIKGMAQGALTSINLDTIKKISVPVPPLPVQEEIVRILDNFTELTDELILKLSEELAARRKQYLEYSHKLFLECDHENTVTLGDVVDVCMCKRIKKDQTNAVEGIPFYQNGTLGKKANLFISKEIFEKYSQIYKFPKTGDVMLSTTGTIGRTIRYDGKPAYFQDSNIVWLNNKRTDVLNDYLYWFCVSMPWELPTRATLRHLHNYMILDTKISIPTVEKQKYIIEKFNQIYDASQSICTSLSNEIEARQKQYEYYRDKLLTFKELS